MKVFCKKHKDVELKKLFWFKTKRSKGKKYSHTTIYQRTELYYCIKCENSYKVRVVTTRK